MISVYVLISLILLGLLYKYIRRVVRVTKEISYKKTIKAINKNERKLNDECDGILTYSRSESKELGFSRTSFKRPSVLKRKGDTTRIAYHKEMAKIKNKLYAKALKKCIPLQHLYTKECFKGKTLRAYVEAMDGSKAILRDNTSIKEVDLNNIYNISGNFILLNIDKEGDDIKVNYVLNDN